MIGSNSPIDPRAFYALRVLLGFDPSPTTPIRYSAPRVSVAEKVVYIVPSRFFGTEYGTGSSLPRLPLGEISGVPILFGEPTLERHGPSLVVRADLLASAYFLLTRYEELVRRDVRDQHGRFPGKESLPFRANFLDRPIVDEYAALLRKWATEMGIDLPTPPRQFSVLLTHDVDTLGPSRGPVQVARCLAAGLLGRRPFRQAVDDAAVALGLKRHPYDNLEEVMQLDGQLTRRFPSERCRSIYFFMAGGSAPHDGAYHLSSARIRSRLRQVATSDADVGLHASYEAGVRPDRVKAERQALEKAAGAPIEKNRHHFLAWREPEHGEILAEAGIHWDASLGYADAAGFRLGVCRPVPLFDPVHRCLLGIEEHPLVVMDCTLDRPHYMNLGEEAAFDYVCRLIDETHRHQGEFVCLWHNTVLASTDTSYHKRLYRRVLDYLAGLQVPVMARTECR